jgi:hypothetical protein
MKRILFIVNNFKNALKYPLCPQRYCFFPCNNYFPAIAAEKGKASLLKKFGISISYNRYAKTTKRLLPGDLSNPLPGKMSASGHRLSAFETAEY